MAGRSKILLEVLWLKPSNSLVRCPQLACLIDIDLACLLRVSLAELLANPQCIQSCLKNAPLAAQICCARQAKSGCEADFRGIKLISIRVAR